MSCPTDHRMFVFTGKTQTTYYYGCQDCELEIALSNAVFE